MGVTRISTPTTWVVLPTALCRHNLPRKVLHSSISISISSISSSSRVFPFLRRRPTITVRGAAAARRTTTLCLRLPLTACTSGLAWAAPWTTIKASISGRRVTTTSGAASSFHRARDCRSGSGTVPTPRDRQGRRRQATRSTSPPTCATPPQTQIDRAPHCCRLPLPPRRSPARARCPSR